MKILAFDLITYGYKRMHHICKAFNADKKKKSQNNNWRLICLETVEKSMCVFGVNKILNGYGRLCKSNESAYRL